MTTKHAEITNDLRTGIDQGKYAPGSTIPGVVVLMREYGVARETARAAIATLAHEGLVTPQRGVGTVVRDTTPVALGYKPNAPAQVWAQQAGANAKDETVEAGWEAADHEVAGRLEVPVDSQVIHLVRHYWKGLNVAQIRDQWLPEAIGTAIAQAGTDLSDTASKPEADLYTLMERAGYRPATVTETVVARMPDPSERDTMEVPAGVPVLITHRVTRDAENKPVETSTTVGCADRMSASFTVPLNR